MNDALRTKLNLIVVALLAFAIGLGVAARFDLTPRSFARGPGEPLQLRLGAPADLQNATVSNSGFADIAERIAPAVVTITTERESPFAARPLPPPLDRFFPQPEPQDTPTQHVSGSGFIITEDGYVVTNNHVVEDAIRIDVQLADGRLFEDVELIGRDATTDVALLNLDSSGLPVAPLGSSDSTRVGEWVLAIGSPGFSGIRVPRLTSTVTAGIVSYKGRNLGIIGQSLRGPNGISPAIEDFIQTDAAINPGNSGGPLVSARGAVIGMNTAIASTSGYYQGYGFAVPIELVREVVEDLVEYGRVRRAMLGVLIDDVSAEEAEYYQLDEVAGVLVSDFSPLTEGTNPAKEAGIEPGDVIVSVEGEPVRSVGDLQRKIRAREPGETIAVELVRRADRRRESVQVTLGEMEGDETGRTRTAARNDRSDMLGLEVSELDARTRRELGIPAEVEGVLVRSVHSRGAASRAGIFPPSRTRDGTLAAIIIVDIDNRPIRSVEDYRRAVSELEPGQVASFLLYQVPSGLQRPVTVRVPRE
ncbi:MAG: trypsin-like peptidase domain-containing protein [Gemmatimonadota bacterium]